MCICILCRCVCTVCVCTPYIHTYVCTYTHKHTHSLSLSQSLPHGIVIHYIDEVFNYLTHRKYIVLIGNFVFSWCDAFRNITLV